mmetsp:Transcript_18644/g.48009  ORF Transcript_18644/g.48009 Transcript_18644/m.48009 type:complete len:578 (+) Transcript_18644:140-1873(+)
MVRYVPEWATLDPSAMTAAEPAQALNLLGGKWVESRTTTTIPDPLNGEPFVRVPDTQVDEIAPFVESLRACPKSGLHNPFHRPERYRLLGDVCARAAAEMRKPEVEDYLSKAIARCSPKSRPQALGEVRISRIFLENFGGDQVRFLARSFAVAGDHGGQASSGHRWPFGPVAIVTPFNFPIEIPCLQLMGALFMGNKPIVKVDSRVSVVFEQFVRLIIHCGLPPTDVDMIHCDGPVMNALLLEARPASTLFTGSSVVAEKLAEELRGKIFIEDAGFDWKILGPDVPTAASMRQYVAWQCDQDAYACSGQKCSAQSILFVHANWAEAGIYDSLRQLAARRSVTDLTVGPTLTVSNARFLEHMKRLLAIPGAKVLFGGEPFKGAEAVPALYGSMAPTAVFVPLRELIKGAPSTHTARFEGTSGARVPGAGAKPIPIVEPSTAAAGSSHATHVQPGSNFELCTTEIFAPFQVVTEYTDAELGSVLRACEGMTHHLTAAVVSNDATFVQRVLGATVNGTTYAGLRARTTGAPQNHWFGPAGDPRAAGIGTPEAIRLVWSCHREVIHDVGPIDAGWTLPPPS